MHLAAADAEAVADLVEEEVALAEVVAVCHAHLVVAVCLGLLEVLCLVRPPGQGHQSAVPRHLIVRAAELPARQRDPVRVPAAGHDLQFSLELDPARVPDQD